VYEFWPSDLQQLFAQAGMPRRKPPPMADCAAAAIGTPPRITSPIASVTYALRSQGDDNGIVPLTANTDGDVQRVHWFVDEAYIGTSAASESLAWRAQLSGRHLVRAIDDQGRADSREVNVSLLQ
jgi:penicillin-binding protein 1C